MPTDCTELSTPLGKYIIGLVAVDKNFIASYMIFFNQYSVARLSLYALSKMQQKHPRSISNLHVARCLPHLQFLHAYSLGFEFKMLSKWNTPTLWSLNITW